MTKTTPINNQARWKAVEVLAVSKHRTHRDGQWVLVCGGCNLQAAGGLVVTQPAPARALGQRMEGQKILRMAADLGKCRGEISTMDTYKTT